MGNLYAQLVILSIRAFKAIPEPLQPYAVYGGYNWYVQLSGRRTIAEGFDCITDLVRNGTAEYVYISPFENSLIGMNQAQLFRSMLKRLPAGWDGGGYGAAVLDEYGEFIPKIKLSENSEKITNPGNKTVFRIYDNET